MAGGRGGYGGGLGRKQGLLDLERGVLALRPVGSGRVLALAG
jgi:hypothetical protein